MESRRSLSFCGAEDDDIEALREYDEQFYGFRSSASAAAEQGSSDQSDDSDDVSDTDDERPAKRIDAGESGDELLCDDDTAAECDEPPHNIERALIAAQIRDSVDAGCGCTAEGVNHWKDLPAENTELLMLRMRNLSKRDLKQFILGELSAGMTTAHGAGQRKFTFSYRVLGQEVCRGIFKEIHGIGRHVLRALQQAAEERLVEVPKHGAVGKKSNKAYEQEIILDVSQFITSYASRWGMPQPAAPRGRAKAAPTYLPATTTKKSVYGEYLDTESPEHVGFSKFKSVWKSHNADIIIMKRRTDVCSWCEKFRERIQKAKTEEAKKAAMDDFAQRMKQADEEREYYKALIADAKRELEGAEGYAANVCHFTFDFAQMLELPHHTRQVGPIYFKSRFRVQLFGVCNEARNTQVNFLFHEGETIGADGKKAHGPNAVISMIHYYLENLVEEPVVLMHADNCVGQNKNRFVMAYLCWRVMHARSEKMQLSFMRVGHTRCSVDAKFGRLKQQFRQSEVDTMEDVVSAVDQSCEANTATRYCWQWYEWDKFFESFFKPVYQIRQFQHFFTTSDQPGKLTMKRSCSSEEEMVMTLLKPGITVENVVAAGMPEPLSEAGISATRMNYLEKQIAEHLHVDKEPPWIDSKLSEEISD